VARTRIPYARSPVASRTARIGMSNPATAGNLHWNRKIGRKVAA
jgi:hypothetical protein